MPSPDKMPRSLREAFGPYPGHLLEPVERPSGLTAAICTIIVVLWVVCLVVFT